MSLEKAEWQEHVKSCQQSKITQKEYCKKHGINYHTLKYWVCKMNKGGQKNKKSGFIEIPLKTTMFQPEITITLLNGIQLTSSPDVAPEKISKLISVLKELK